MTKDQFIKEMAQRGNMKVIEADKKRIVSCEDRRTAQRTKRTAYTAFREG